MKLPGLLLFIFICFTAEADTRYDSLLQISDAGVAGIVYNQQIIPSKKDSLIHVRFDLRLTVTCMGGTWPGNEPFSLMPKTVLTALEYTVDSSQYELHARDTYSLTLRRAPTISGWQLTDFNARQAVYHEKSMPYTADMAWYADADDPDYGISTRRQVEESKWTCIYEYSQKGVLIYSSKFRTGLHNVRIAKRKSYNYNGELAEKSRSKYHVYPFRYVRWTFYEDGHPCLHRDKWKHRRRFR